MDQDHETRRRECLCPRRHIHRLVTRTSQPPHGQCSSAARGTILCLFVAGWWLAGPRQRLLSAALLGHLVCWRPRQRLWAQLSHWRLYRSAPAWRASDDGGQAGSLELKCLHDLHARSWHDHSATPENGFCSQPTAGSGSYFGCRRSLTRVNTSLIMLNFLVFSVGSRPGSRRGLCPVFGGLAPDPAHTRGLASGFLSVPVLAWLMREVRFRLARSVGAARIFRPTRQGSISRICRSE